MSSMKASFLFTADCAAKTPEQQGGMNNTAIAAR